MELIVITRVINGKSKTVAKLGNFKGKSIYYREVPLRNAIMRNANCLCYDYEAVNKAIELGVEEIITYCPDTKDLFVTPIDKVKEPNIKTNAISGELRQYWIPNREPFVIKFCDQNKPKLGWTDKEIVL